MKRYMVVEHFRDGCTERVYDRFHSDGRLLPEGLRYLNSWVNAERSICFQLMETADPALFEIWFARWADLVRFELYPLD